MLYFHIAVITAKEISANYFINSIKYMYVPV